MCWLRLLLALNKFHKDMFLAAFPDYVRYHVFIIELNLVNQSWVNPFYSGCTPGAGLHSHFLSCRPPSSCQDPYVPLLSSFYLPPTPARLLPLTSDSSILQEAFRPPLSLGIFIKFPHVSIQQEESWSPPSRVVLSTSIHNPPADIPLTSTWP